MTKLDEVAQLINDNEVKKLQLMLKLEQEQRLFVQQIPKLERDMAAIREEISKFQKGIDLKPKRTNEVFQDLKELDRVLMRMKETKALLKDADNWNTVQIELESLLISKDFLKASKRLLDAKKSLDMLSDAQNYQERKSLLEKLTNQFIELLTKEFTDTIMVLTTSDESVETGGLSTGCKLLVELAQQFGKQQLLLDRFFESRKPLLVKGWNPAADLQSLQSYFGSLDEQLPTEFEFLAHIFDDPSVRINELLLVVFKSLDPSFESILQNIAARKYAILDLLQAYEATVSFASDIEQKFPVQQELVWGAFVFEQFLPHQKQFAVYEKQYLEDSIRGLLTSIENKNEQSNKIYSALVDSMLRYKKFTLEIVSVNFGTLYDDVIGNVVQYHKDYLKKCTPVANKSDNGNAIQPKFIPDDYEQMLQQHIQNLNHTVYFVNLISKFFRKLEEGPELRDSNDGVQLRTCKAALSSLKSLHREFSVHEHTPQQFFTISQELLLVAQNNVLESLLITIKTFLVSIPHIGIWKSNAALEKFSVSPSSYITSIGEHLLTLPHLFDPYVQDESLSFVVKSLPMYDPSQEEDDDFDPTFAWVYATIKLTERFYLDQLFLIRNMTPSGSKQIMADLEYLQNVLAALDIKPDKDLEGMMTWIDKPVEDLSRESENPLVQRILQIKS